MSDENINIEKNDSKQDDPLEELNEFDDKNPTIERENDVFDELELRNLDDLPSYNSKSNTIVDNPDKQINENIKKITEELSDQKDNVDELKSDMQTKTMMEVIDEVDVNNQKVIKDNKPKEDKKEEIKTSIAESIKASLKDNKSNKAKKVKPKVKPKKLTKEVTDKKIDNVKVDEEGVPLLNQFDTEKIKDNAVYNKISFSKRNLSQIIVILIGFIFIIIGIIQSFNDVVKISDNVMYGEHASMAIGLVFLGMLLIVLAFYKEIMGLLGLDAIYNSDVSKTPKKQFNNKKTFKKQDKKMK